MLPTSLVVINRKTTKFESNSQHSFVVILPSFSCYQSQNYKIWKQFTTYLSLMWRSFIVVINRKTTKFESNSQLVDDNDKKRTCCYQSQNYKIWKQFTTPIITYVLSAQLLSIAKLQNLKAIHNYDVK